MELTAESNALAESVIGLYKTELVKARRPWRRFDDLEIATAEWVDWYNHRRPFDSAEGEKSRPKLRPTAKSRASYTV